MPSSFEKERRYIVVSYCFVFERHNLIKYFCKSWGFEINRGNYFFVEEIFWSSIRYMFNFFSKVRANSTEEIVKFVSYNGRVFGWHFVNFYSKRRFATGFAKQHGSYYFPGLSCIFFLFLGNSV